jgi:cob(I)alamin adenosyltransferase
MPFIGEVVKEMRTRPYTMVVILALTVAVPYMWKTTAKADDVADIKQQVTHIDAALLEAKLRDINNELFDIKQKVADKQDAHEHVDQLYLDRIVALESDKAQTERELTALGAVSP